MEEEDPLCLRDAGNLTIAGLVDAGNPTLESWNVVVVEALVTPFTTELVSPCRQQADNTIQQRYAK